VYNALETNCTTVISKTVHDPGAGAVRCAHAANRVIDGMLQEQGM